MLVYAVLVSLGWSRGARAEIMESWRVGAELARREQVARVAQAQTAERARIAREMHDVLAHKISLISLHAGVLSYQDDLSREETAPTAGVIQETAHQALEELREVLGVLLDESTRPSPRRSPHCWTCRRWWPPRRAPVARSPCRSPTTSGSRRRRWRPPPHATPTASSRSR